MTITLNGTTGISNDGGYTGDGISFAESAPSNSLVVNSSGNVGIGTSSPYSGGGVKTLQLTSSDYSIFEQSVTTATAGYQNWRQIVRGSAGGHVYQLQLMNDANSAEQTIYEVSRTANSVAYQRWYAGTSEAMRIDSSGNVGIGTSSPDSKLHVAGTGSNQIANFRNTQSADGTFGYITVGGAGGSGGIIGQTNNATASSQYVFIGNLGDDVVGNGLRVYRSSHNVVMPTGNLLVNTTAQLTPGGVGGKGNILVPTDSGEFALTLQNNATTNANGRGLGIRLATDFNNGANEFIFCVGNNTARFYVQSNGGVYNYQANNTNLSDRREKTNFAPAGEYLNKICAIPVQTFNYIDQNIEEDDGLTLGVVAQDVQAVAPELVTESNWGTKEEPKMRLSIYQTDLQYALMKAIQELKAELDATKAELDATKAEVNDLKAQLEAK